MGHLLRSISATQELDPVGLVHLIVDETALFNWLTWSDAVPNGLKLHLVQGRPSPATEVYVIVLYLGGTLLADWIAKAVPE